MIKNSLWKRMVFGYIIIASFMLAMSFYLIFRLNHLNKVTDSIMKTDIPSVENGEKLVDSLLGQVRNEKKYLITNDDAFLDLFDKKKKEFLGRLKSIEVSTKDREKKVFINQIKELHNKYLSMVSKEIALVGSAEIIPPDSRYEEEIKKTLDLLTESINRLTIALQTGLIKIKEMDQMKSEFVSNISHNFKTPLTAIREANDLLLEKIAGPIPEPQIKLLTIIKEEAHQLTMMISDLLDISRVEAGLMRYNFQSSDIHDVIRKSMDEIRFLAENKNIHIQCENGDWIPKIILDRDKIVQVMDNLLSNAIKFTLPGGTIT